MERVAVRVDEVRLIVAPPVHLFVEASALESQVCIGMDIRLNRKPWGASVDMWL